MSKAEFAAYVSNVEHFLRINHVGPGCHSPVYKECGEGDPVEPFFSWSPCECCGGRLGGNRETYSFATEGEALVTGQAKVFQADICVDCVYYLAYGTLDDETMQEVGK
jgi:hypothetical protein